VSRHRAPMEENRPRPGDPEIGHSALAAPRRRHEPIQLPSESADEQCRARDGAPWRLVRIFGETRRRRATRRDLERWACGRRRPASHALAVNRGRTGFQPADRRRVTAPAPTPDVAADDARQARRPSLDASDSGRGRFSWAAVLGRQARRLPKAWTAATSATPCTSAPPHGAFRATSRATFRATARTWSATRASFPASRSTRRSTARTGARPTHAGPR
jgi:hypothetical protein